jgi:hypothetical protein
MNEIVEILVEELSVAMSDCMVIERVREDVINELESEVEAEGDLLFERVSRDVMKETFEEVVDIEEQEVELCEQLWQEMVNLNSRNIIESCHERLSVQHSIALQT